MVKYIRLCEGLNDKGKLISPEEISDYINTVESREHDWYSSIYYYTDKHLEQFQKTGTISGITDVKTDKLVFDFDSKQDIEMARTDTIEAISRLEKFGIKDESIEIYFSGQKGFSLVVPLEKELTPQQLSDIAINKIGYGLKTLDTSIYNASRIFRLPGTRHQASGLYKIPLDKIDIQELPIESIKELASQFYDVESRTPAKPLPELFETETIDVTPEVADTDFEVDYSKKPSRWTNCKWSIAQGNFGPGERHTALTILAATCRGFGFTKDMTYDICKGALRRSHEKFGKGGTTKDELYENIIEQSIFGDNWKGGQYTCKKDPWLKLYCESLGEHKCEAPEDDAPLCMPMDKMWKDFIDYAENFEKNLIKVGLESFDSNVVLTTSALYGLLGAPGAAKTTVALQFLRNASKQGIPSMFFSMDMGNRPICAKLIQNETGIPYRSCLELVKANKNRAIDLMKQISPKYENVAMSFKCGLNVEQIREGIEEQNKINGPGNEVKFVVIDYLENISSQYSDQTASTGYIANCLKDLATELNVCILLLLQTQKHSTPEVSDPLLNLRGVKGSSLIEQACSCIISIWREGYGPQYKDNDKYLSMAVIKNRFGELWRGDFSWEGKRGQISELSEEQEVELKDFLKSKEEMKRSTNNNFNKWD
jgi:KaiC/GvpD/RAD55 family RecA-like ATPase